MNEQRSCNECGETWNDTGACECPFCGSDDTFIVPDDIDFESEERKG
jgi:hypothetical protein